MMLTLLWLTISTPFVVSFQQEMAKQGISFEKTSPLSTSEDEIPNPLSNSNEEKPASNSSLSSLAEEYLHDNHKTEYRFAAGYNYHSNENADTYTAFHGELLVPPPNFS